VNNFYSGVNFCGEKICGNFTLWELIFADSEKTAKIAKIRTRKNLVPHGIHFQKWYYVTTWRALN